MQSFSLVIGKTLENFADVDVASSDTDDVSVVVLGKQGNIAARNLLEARSAEARELLGRQCEIGYVVLDRRHGVAQLFAAPIGLQQIYWTVDGERLRIGSAPDQLTHDNKAKRALRLDSIYQYVYFHCIPGPPSVYEGISKLPGGHRLTWDGAAAKVERYWRPAFQDEERISERDASTELHSLLNAAVRRSIGEQSAFGTFLSGGLDSSTVTGLAARLHPRVPSVTMGFDAAGYDEMEFARIASRRFGTTPLEYYVTPEDLLRDLADVAAAFPEPFGNSSAAAAFHCARIARDHGIGLLLAGDGGDEIFGGNTRYAKQLVFERYFRVPPSIRNQVIEPIVSAAARLTTAFPVGKAQSYVEQANVRLPDRLQSYNFLHRHDPAEVFESDLLAAVDQSIPLRMLREEYDVPTTSSPVNRMLFLDWKFTLHDNDLVKVNHMCARAGVEVGYPMLDQSIVDFSTRLPASWKVRGNDLRWFYKRSMSRFLPAEIIGKSKHGFGLPFGVWTRTHAGLRRQAEDALASLAERGYFKPTFLRDALRLHAEGHASYYGELVWILMVLELWLQSHMPDARL